MHRREGQVHIPTEQVAFLSLLDYFFVPVEGRRKEMMTIV